MTNDPIQDAFDPRFKLFHELMGKKIREILLVSSPYDAWIMEEDCRLSERIVSEYRGLNLSNPPRLTWMSSAAKALAALDEKPFDMVITMPYLLDMCAEEMGRAVKEKHPHLPVVLFQHGAQPVSERGPNAAKAIDRTFVWTGDTDILLAVVKSSEDRMNAARDTASAGIRIIIFVEDAPEYISSLLPILYRQLVLQTQAVIHEGLNEEHRLLAMRARPKILVAESYEEAIELYERYNPFVLGVISDVRFPRNHRLDGQAGLELLRKIKQDRFDIPLLLASSDPENRSRAAEIPAMFVDKNSPSLLAEFHAFFHEHLGFGDFVFRLPEGREIGRATNLRSLEHGLKRIPDTSFAFHCRRNDFSRWLFARTEIELASRIRPIRDWDFSSGSHHRENLISIIHRRRKERQKGVVVNFDAESFDPETEFLKIGTGSLGGKARGLAFMSFFLNRHREFREAFADVDIFIPRTLVITTDGFDRFVKENDLAPLGDSALSDERIAQAFLAAPMPETLVNDLRGFLAHAPYPLAVRSSSLLEDAQFQAYAGLYKTYMLPNDNPDPACRLDQLLDAVRLVYASTYFREPRAFSRRVGQRTEQEKMAVLVQQAVGDSHGGFFYPAISGVAQSRNYYPFAGMKPDDGIATIALGLGKMVAEGEKTLRFCPKAPQLLPQFSRVEDILENAQQRFYALKLGGACVRLGVNEAATLVKRDVFEAAGEPAVDRMASTYFPEENRIRDMVSAAGVQVITFAQVLRFGAFPLADILRETLQMGKKGMGCPVEIEFSVNLGREPGSRRQFAILQIGPMTAREASEQVVIDPGEEKRAFCFSTNALGNAMNRSMSDILFVPPERFNPGRTVETAREIGRMNAELLSDNRRYVLIGPGRWGSADRWLGIPVTWSEICGVGAIVETDHPDLKVEPSQGSHFFHNITTLGINYITVTGKGGDFIDWDWLLAQPVHRASDHVHHVRLPRPFTLKVDGKRSLCVMIAGSAGAEGR